MTQKEIKDIFEAVTNYGCTTYREITDLTEVNIVRIKYLMGDFLPEMLKKIKKASPKRKESDKEKARRAYTEGTTLSELEEKTGVAYKSLREIMPSLKQEMNSCRAELIDIMLDHFVRQGDDVIVPAYVYSKISGSPFGFPEIYSRARDVAQGSSVASCASKWGVQFQSVYKFISKFLPYAKAFKSKSFIKAYEIQGNEEISKRHKNMAYPTEPMSQLINVMNSLLKKKSVEEGDVAYSAFVYSRSKGKHYSYEEIYNRMADIKAGIIPAECARRWGVTRQAAHNYILRTPLIKQTELTPDDAAFLYNPVEKNSEEIAEAFNLPRSKVIYFLNKAGLHLSRGRPRKQSIA